MNLFEKVNDNKRYDDEGCVCCWNCKYHDSEIAKKGIEDSEYVRDYCVNLEIDLISPTEFYCRDFEEKEK